MKRDEPPINTPLWPLATFAFFAWVMSFVIACSGCTLNKHLKKPQDGLPPLVIPGDYHGFTNAPVMRPME
tara:strand:- start:958 stop:1167 length:210 start_codon:yes stop_codon:yes gene_type:complete